MEVETARDAHAPITSPFLHPGATASTDSLAILHLRRDHLLPEVLRNPDELTADYAEGHVTNTRFGSFPHSTLVGSPWGSQVLASKVDTGSRGGRGKKRKLAEALAADGEDSERAAQPKAAITAASGFAHLLPPTPETWTVSLPHRTQVVYTPDYSYILQKLRVRPGSTIIEAGAGSGSFTHASARVVFNGYPELAHAPPRISPAKSGRAKHHGRVFSYEYHEPRAIKLQEEIISHGLASLVRVTHRNVYEDGFLVAASSDPSRPLAAPSATTTTTALSSVPPPLTSPNATAIFLDLPAPWLALPHLTRSSPSPLHPTEPVHICCFLPCIEQATQCVAALRTHHWLEIDMQELLHRRIDVRRERIGLDLEGLRGVNAGAATFEEAVNRLVEIEKHAQARATTTTAVGDEDGDESIPTPSSEPPQLESKAARMKRIAAEEAGRKTFKEGRLIHRTEPEIKTHTSYLVFAVLPREWSVEEEMACRERWKPERTAEEDGGKGKGRGGQGNGGNGGRGGKNGKGARHMRENKVGRKG